MSRLISLLLPALLVLAACGGQQAERVAQAAAKPGATSLSVSDYKLAAGDTVRVTTYGDASLSGDFVIDDSGRINMPLVGAIDAANTTRGELESRVTARLKDGYMVNPKVSVDIIRYRPFYIVGEVQQPGSYDYAVDLTLLKAVAIAGGFTPRADTDGFIVYRGTGTKQRAIQADANTLLMPGDSVLVDERFF